MKRLHLIVIILLITGMASAQKRLQKEEFYLGAQGGYMASMVYFSPVVGQEPLKSQFGPTAGLVFRYAGHKVCGLQLELNYMQRGWHEVRTDYRRTLDYIEMPMLWHLYFGKKFRGFFNLGPQIGYLVHESQNGLSDIPNAWEEGYSSKTAHQYAKAEKPFDWGLAAGLGMYYRSRYAGVYQLEARFNYSLGSVFNSTQMDYFTMASHMNLAVTFAYMWQIKPRPKETTQKHQL